MTLAIDRHRESLTDRLLKVQGQLTMTEQQLLERDKQLQPLATKQRLHDEGAKQQIHGVIVECERKSFAMVELRTKHRTSRPR